MSGVAQDHVSKQRPWLTWLDHPRRVWVRKAVFQIHLWSGLLVGLLATVIGVSGSAIVYRQALDRKLAPRFHRVTAGHALPADELLHTAHLAAAQWRVTGLAIEDANDSWVFRLDRREQPGLTVSVDPVSGAVLGLRGEQEGIMNWLEMLHVELLGGTTGLYVNGVGAILLFGLCLSGVVLWWPGRKNARRALRIRWFARWPRLNWDVHTAGGFWISLPLAVQAFSGIFLCFGLAYLLPVLGGRADELEKLFAPAHASSRTAAAHPLQAAMRRARSLYPEAARIFVRFPNAPEEAITVYMSSTSDQLFGRIAVVCVDPATGEVLKDVKSRDGSPALNATLWLDAFHFGLAGGPLSRPLWVLLGLCPGILFLTGFIIWLRRIGKPSGEATREVMKRLLTFDHDELSDNSATSP